MTALTLCDPAAGPADRQYKDVLLQPLPREYKAIRQSHLERGDFGLADIRRMMAAICADNLARSRSGSFRGITGRSASMQKMTAIAMASSATFVMVSATSRLSAPYGSSNSRRMMDSSRHSSLRTTEHPT